MRHQIVIALNSLKIFNKIFLMKKKSFFAEFDVSDHSKINKVFYKMNIVNAHCILRDAIISIVFAIAFFSSSNSLRIINIIAMFNSIIFNEF